MRAKLILSFMVVILAMVVVNAIFYYVVRDEFLRLWLSAIVGIAVGVVLGVVISRWLTARIADLAAVTHQIAAGDLTKEVARAADRELEELAGAFRTMVGQLRMVVAQIQESAGSLNGAATGFSATAQQMSTSGEEIAAATEHIAKGAELQVEVVERASGQIRQGAAAIARIAERARLAAEASAAAGDTAQRGGAAAAEALEKMRTVFEKMEGSAGLVHGFGERTQKIGKIVEVITGISQQTNLLALNAAIEAAHAGEYGRGFSVVADEIRKLAEATRRSAEEITALVAEIGKESLRVLATMEAGTLEMRQGREVIDTVRGSLDRIVHATVDVAQGVGEISKLAADQARGADEMVKATEEISRIAEDNAAATEEASAATEELTASLEQMAGSAHDLAQLAGGLRHTASRFTVAARA
ncbi:MAG TPA: methyl-accepting chemotaxis protein [bacterium]